MKKFLSALWAFASSWTGTIVIVLILIFFVMLTVLSSDWKRIAKLVDRE